jgi:Flp pilus assembly protein TadG
MAEIKKRRGFLRSEEGAELVEFALVLPLLLLVMLGIAEFGFMFQRYEVLTNAAREGARIAVLPGYTAADVQARVSTYLTAGRVPTTTSNPVVVVTNQALVVPGGTTISMRRVTVTYTYSYMFLRGIGGWFGGGFTTQTLSAVSEMRVEVAGA